MSEGIPENSSPLPPNEASYNPRLFMEMVRDPNAFSKELPACFFDIAKVNEGKGFDNALFNLQKDVEKIRKDAPFRFLDEIYRDFAKKNGWMLKGEGDFEGLEDIQPMEALSKEQENAWREYLNEGEVPREVAIMAFHEGIMIPFSSLPPYSHARNFEVKQLYTALHKAPYQMALTFFPDLTDAEAKQLSGNKESNVDSIKGAAS